VGWAVSAEPDEFTEAVAWFRERVPVTDQEYEALTAAEKTRAFHLASLNELRVVQTVFEELATALAQGLPVETFHKNIADKLGAAHKLDGHHLDLVFHNAAQDAYNAGRWQQMTSMDVSASRPYWMFDAVMDDHTTKHICRPLDGTIKAHDDPWWLTHWPQLHHRCRSGVRNLRRTEAEKRGITVGDPQGVTVGEGFGLAPPKRTELPQPDRDNVDADALTVFDHRRATDPDNTNE
jgi:SPP1 gp7 family putative phage head morphogenesis protein